MLDDDSTDARTTPLRVHKRITWPEQHVILSEPAGRAKDLCFGNERSFAAAQDDNPKDGKLYFYEL